MTNEDRIKLCNNYMDIDLRLATGESDKTSVLGTLWELEGDLLGEVERKIEKSTDTEKVIWRECYNIIITKVENMRKCFI